MSVTPAQTDGLAKRAYAPAADAASAAAWWRGAVIYQIYPRSFLDTAGDGVGDLNGITAKLDYVADLGVDAVWLSPFFKSPMRDYGYDVADYCDVDPIFGSLADFDRLVETAHRLGLKVVIDQVYSHTSDAHAWFEESRKDRLNARADWYVWADARPDGTPPNNWLSVFGGPAWTWDTRRRQYYLHNFLSSQPDLNLHNPYVQDALIEVARFWLDRGVDGFRLDAINFGMHDPELRDNPPTRDAARPLRKPHDHQDHVHNQSHPDMPAFLERLRTVADGYGDIFTVAEIGGADPLPEMKSFTADGPRLNSAYSFDFLYADHMTPQVLAGALQAWSGAEGEGWPSWAFSNHDAPRAVSRWSAPEKQQAAAKLYLLLLSCLRGNAFLYQGEELGLPQAEIPFAQLRDPEAIANWPLTLGRDGARTPFPWAAGAANAGFSVGAPWLPVSDEHAALAVDAQLADPQSTLHFARAVIKLRRETPVLRSGALDFVEAPAGVAAFVRRDDAHDVLCVFNLSDAQIDWTPPDASAYRLAFAVGLNVDDAAPPRTLAPYTAYLAVRAT